MGPAALTDEARKEWDYSLTITKKEGAYNKYTLKGSQFEPPLLEFSAACAGCGEKPGHECPYIHQKKESRAYENCMRTQKY